MKQTLVLLAGFPGTGKTYLANMIKEKYLFFEQCSPDAIKEFYWDKYGFNNLEEKEELIVKSWEMFYQKLDDLFTMKLSLICDYPFSEKQYNKLLQITNQHNVQVLTLRLIGDLKVLFDRQKYRDLDDERHLGHIVSEYHKGVKVSHNQADNLLDYQEFENRCTTRGYDTFALGTTLEIDVTKFEDVNYDELLLQIGRYIEYN